MRIRLRRGAVIWDSGAQRTQDHFSRVLLIDGERTRIGMQPIKCQTTQRTGYVWPEDIAEILPDERKTS